MEQERIEFLKEIKESNLVTNLQQNTDNELIRLHANIKQRDLVIHISEMEIEKLNKLISANINSSLIEKITIKEQILMALEDLNSRQIQQTNLNSKFGQLLCAKEEGYKKLLVELGDIKLRSQEEVNGVILEWEKKLSAIQFKGKIQNDVKEMEIRKLNLKIETLKIDIENYLLYFEDFSTRMYRKISLEESLYSASLAELSDTITFQSSDLLSHKLAITEIATKAVLFQNELATIRTDKMQLEEQNRLLTMQYESDLIKSGLERNFRESELQLKIDSMVEELKVNESRNKFLESQNEDLRFEILSFKNSSIIQKLQDEILKLNKELISEKINLKNISFDFSETKREFIQMIENKEIGFIRIVDELKFIEKSLSQERLENQRLELEKQLLLNSSSSMKLLQQVLEPSISEEIQFSDIISNNSDMHAKQITRF